MLEARVAELNENNGSLEASLAAAEAEVKRLKLAGHGAGGLDAGDAERLASLLESQTQALEEQCMRLQYDTTYIRKVSNDVRTQYTSRTIRLAGAPEGRWEGGSCRARRVLHWSVSVCVLYV